MTTGTEWKRIFLFSLPIMAGNLLQQLYNTVDGIVVGNYVSQNALAATGTAGTLAMLFLAFAIGLGNGSGIMIAQLFGARRYGELKSAISTALILLVGVGLLLSVFGFSCARFLCGTVMNIEAGETLEQAVLYFSIYSLGFVLQFAYNTVAAILRAVGDSKATLYFLIVSSVMNLALDMLFVVSFGWGVAGAAAATVFSQLCATVVSIVYMFRKYDIFRFAKGEFVYSGEKCVLCLKLGIPTTCQQCVVGFGNVLVQRLINSFGDAAMAAFTAGGRIENYLFVPAVGFNISLSNFTAQNTGAEKPERIRRGLRATVLMSFLICVLLSAASNLFAVDISRLFGLSDEALAYSVEYVRFLSFFFWLFASYMPFAGLLQGSGDVMVSMFSSLITLGGRVCMAYFFARVLLLGYASVWYAMPIGWVCGLTFSGARYLSGRWKTKGIVKKEGPTLE